jgi:hypothetical protein
MRIAYTVCQFRMPILEIAHKILKKLKISPNPIIVAYHSLKTQRRIGMHSPTGTNTHIFFNQYHTIYSCILWDATIVSQLASVLVLNYFITIQPEEINASYMPFNVMVSRQTVFYIWTHFFLPNSQLIQPNNN